MTYSCYKKLGLSIFFLDAKGRGDGVIMPVKVVRSSRKIVHFFRKIFERLAIGNRRAQKAGLRLFDSKNTVLARFIIKLNQRLLR